MRKILILLMLLLLPTKSFSAVIIDKVDDYLTCGSAAALDDIASMSISAWVYAIDGGENGFGRIAEKLLVSGVSRGWAFFINSSGQLAFFRSFNSNASSKERDSAASAVSFNAWHHVVVTDTRSTTSNTAIKLYVDGAEVSYTGGFTSDGSGSVDSDATRNFLIGNNDSTTRSFNGRIAFIQAWNKILTSTDVAALYAAGIKTTPPNILSPSNIKASWLLNECADGKTCSAAGQFLDLVASSTCTGTNGPIGMASPVSYVSNGTITNGTIN